MAAPITKAFFFKKKKKFSDVMSITDESGKENPYLATSMRIPTLVPID